MKQRSEKADNAENFKPDYQLETKYGSAGAVIGVDEAGRGPWAGPVTASAFWINPSHLDSLPASLTDSKKLSASKRADIRAALIHADYGHVFATSQSEAEQIDRIGLLPATFAAMKQAVETVIAELARRSVPVSHIIVDGNLLPPWQWPSSAIIKGDSKSLSIAAASVLAKTDRDHHMTELAQTYPAYGWDKNAGYGTRAHREALAIHGVTPYHRTSFAPIKALLEGAD